MLPNNAPHCAGEKRRTSVNCLPRPRVGANVEAAENELRLPRMSASGPGCVETGDAVQMRCENRADVLKSLQGGADAKDADRSLQVGEPMKAHLGTHACDRSGQSNPSLPEGSVQRLLDRPLDVQPMHFPVERVAADAELARDVADVAMLEIQLPEQRLALRSSERIERVHLGRGRRRLCGPQAQTVVGRQIG